MNKLSLMRASTTLKWSDNFFRVQLKLKTMQKQLKKS